MSLTVNIFAGPL